MANLFSNLFRSQPAMVFPTTSSALQQANLANTLGTLRDLSTYNVGNTLSNIPTFNTTPVHVIPPPKAPVISPTHAQVRVSAPRQGTVTKPGKVAGTAIVTPQSTAVQTPVETTEVLQGPTQEQIDAAFSPTFDYLNQLQSSYQNQLPDIISGITSQYESYKPALQQAKGELLQANQADIEATRQARQNALNEAAQLYSELGQANRQRFGGSSSAGEFASQLQGREFQRRQGQIQDTTAQNVAKLQQQAQGIESNYNLQLVDIDRQKNAALLDARQRFEDQLRQIDANRAQTEQAKAQAKLELINQLNQQAQAISQYHQQLQDQLGAQTLSAVQQIAANLQTYRINQGQQPDLTQFPGFNYTTMLGQRNTPNPVLVAPARRRFDESALTPTGFFRPEDLALNPA